MSTQAETHITEALFSIGDPEAVTPKPPRRGEVEPSPVRGLTIRRLTLNKNYDGRIAGLFGRESEIYFLASSIMFGEETPFVWPIAKDGGEHAVMELKKGETFEFDLGAGAPLAPERELKSGLAVSVWVMESDNNRVRAGEKMEAAADAVKNDGNIAKILGQAITNPGAFGAQQVLGAVGELAKVVAAILKRDNDEFVSFFDAYFPMRGSWDGMLISRKEGATIELNELPRPG
jgi:hypothetical protein